MSNNYQQSTIVPMITAHGTTSTALDATLPESKPCEESRSSTTPRPIVVIDARLGGSLWSYLRELIVYRELLLFLAWRDVLIKYRRTLLGVGWIFIQPALQACVLWWLISGRMTSGSLSIEILTKILLGTTLWLYVANTILASVHHLSTSAHLITKVYFPRALLVLAPAVAQLLDLALMSVLIFIAAAISGLLHGQLYLLAFPYVGAMLYVLGPALITSGLAARFRDIKHIAPYFLQLWFFCTPNIYVPDFTPQGVSTIIMAILNPLNYWVMAAQHIVSKENVPITLWTMAAVSSLLWCLVGLWIFMRLERTLADHI